MTMNNARDTRSEDADGSESLRTGVSHIAAAALPFEQLVSDHLPFVWRVLRRFGLRAPDIDDAAQRVFLIANDKLSSIRVGSERAFLVAVAMRVASHTRRANQRREAAQQRWLEAHRSAAPLNEPAKRVEARDLLDAVLDRMPDNLRAVFILFEFEELTIDEVATLLSLPRGTVASRLRKARQVFQAVARALECSTQGNQL